MGKSEVPNDAADRGTRRATRLLYIVLLVVLMVPRIYPIILPMRIAPNTLAAFQAIQNLPPGSRVLVDVGLDASNWPYVGPGLVALMLQILSLDLKFIVVCGGSPIGPVMAQMVFDRIPASYLESKTYGVDYIRLGYVAGEEAAVASFALQFKSNFPTDFRGTPLSEMPLWQAIKDARDFSMVVNAPYGEQYLYYVRHWQVSMRTPIVFAVPAAAVPYIRPFYAAGQIIGFIGGVRGSAEYESLIRRPKGAAAEMTSISLAVLVILGCVAAGNVEYWRKKRVRGQEV